VGAGPKALALAAKAKVLNELGFEVPRVLIIEKKEVAHHWKKSSHFTNGNLPLGTSPEKDLGFPYYSFCWGDRVNQQVNQAMQSYSWSAFLIERLTYSDWIDRGKPAPFHHEWAAYLEWSLSKCVSESDDLVVLKNNKITNIDIDGEKWIIESQNSKQEFAEHRADGVVFTGPGIMRLPFSVPRHERIFTYDEFWKNESQLVALKDKKIALVGAGENAATIAVRLGQTEPSIGIDLIAPNATSYTRGESFAENHLYTDPFQGNWLNLTKEDRREFVKRTDRGVFSVSTKRQLDHLRDVHMIQGLFTSVKVDALDQLNVGIEYNTDSENKIYDYLILAVGFDYTYFVESLLSPEAIAKIKKDAGLGEFKREILEENIDENLALQNFDPCIHLPMLAGLNQGPGFANLSCLGRLSDHILARHTPARQQDGLV
jgi:mycobactin lysine-N-oxygenase